MNSTPTQNERRAAISAGQPQSSDGAPSSAPRVETTRAPGDWSRERWLTVIGIFFVAQIGLLALFGAHGRNSPAKVKTSTAFHLLPQPLGEEKLAQSFFASDPMLFAAASWHGFSGEAWLRRPAQKYEMTESDEPPYWLANKADRLGNFPQVSGDTTTEAAFAFSEKLSSAVEPLPFFIAAETIRTQSFLRVEGDLAGQLRKISGNLRVQINSDLVTNSVVQIAANGVGEVVSARLVVRSGYAVADREALAVARGLRFKPIVPGNGSRWGKVIFDWQTIAPPATNGTKQF